MKLTKDNICVYIENEAQLKEARELLKKYGELIKGGGLFAFKNNEGNLLALNGSKAWGLYSFKLERETEISLTELEQILAS